MSESASLRPSDHIQGGLIDDVDVEFINAEFVVWDYQGKSGGTQSPVLHLSMKILGEEDVYEQYYSAGDLGNWVPSDDGKRLERAGTPTQLANSCNLSLFLASLVNGGFPEGKMADEATFMVGTKAHVNRTAQPERPGLARAADDSRKPTVLLVTKILGLPGEKMKGKKSKGKAKPSAAPEEVTEKATEVLMGILADEEGGKIKKSALSKAVFAAMGNDALRNKVVQLAYKEDFLSAEEAPWEYDGTELSLG